MVPKKRKILFLHKDIECDLLNGRKSHKKFKNAVKKDLPS